MLPISEKANELDTIDYRKKSISFFNSSQSNTEIKKISSNEFLTSKGNSTVQQGVQSGRYYQNHSSSAIKQKIGSPFDENGVKTLPWGPDNHTSSSKDPGEFALSYPPSHNPEKERNKSLIGNFFKSADQKKKLTKSKSAEAGLSMLYRPEFDKSDPFFSQIRGFKFDFEKIKQHGSLKPQELKGRAQNLIKEIRAFEHDLATTLDIILSREYQADRAYDSETKTKRESVTITALLNDILRFIEDSDDASMFKKNSESDESNSGIVIQKLRDYLNSSNQDLLVYQSGEFLSISRSRANSSMDCVEKTEAQNLLSQLNEMNLNGHKEDEMMNAIGRQIQRSGVRKTTNSFIQTDDEFEVQLKNQADIGLIKQIEEDFLKTKALYHHPFFYALRDRTPVTTKINLSSGKHVQIGILIVGFDVGTKQMDSLFSHMKKVNETSQDFHDASESFTHYYTHQFRALKSQLIDVGLHLLRNYVLLFQDEVKKLLPDVEDQIKEIHSNGNMDQLNKLFEKLYFAPVHTQVLSDGENLDIDI